MGFGMMENLKASSHRLVDGGAYTRAHAAPAANAVHNSIVTNVVHNSVVTNVVVAH